METAGPIDCDVDLVLVKPGGADEGSAGAEDTEVIESIEHGAILSDID